MDENTEKIIPQPQNIHVENNFDVLKISYRWFSFAYIFTLVFCIAWDSFLIFWYSMLTPDVPWIFFVFPIGHVAVGLGLTYFTIVGFINKTLIIVDRHFLSVNHYPLPWFGNKKIEVNKIIQLYTEEISRSSRNSGNSFSYQLNAILHGNTKLKLLYGLPSADTVRFVERTIEDYLRIKDANVEGELKK